MTKTIEEGVLEIIWEIVKHCYHQGQLPWQHKRQQQRRLDADIAARDNERNEYAYEYWSYNSLPLSVEESAQPEASHQQHIQEADLRIDNAPPQNHIQQYLRFERPRFLRNHVGVNMENPDAIEDWRPHPPVLIDRNTRQVLLSQRALWELINLVPWGDLPNRRHQNENRPMEASNTNQSRETVQNRRHNEQVTGAAAASQSASASLPGETPNAGGVPTSLRVLSTKCLSRISRLCLSELSGKANYDALHALDERLREMNKTETASPNKDTVQGNRKRQSFIQKLLKLEPLDVSAENHHRLENALAGGHMSLQLSNENRAVTT